MIYIKVQFRRTACGMNLGSDATTSIPNGSWMWSATSTKRPPIRSTGRSLSPSWSGSIRTAASPCSGTSGGRPGQKLRASKNYNPDDLQAYMDHHVKTSPISPACTRCRLASPPDRRTFISEDELKKTEYYNEYLKPRRLGHYATGMMLDRGPGRLVALSIADQRNDADRRARQFQLVKILGPHLMRAFRLHRAFAAQKATGEAAQAALDRWVHAALVFNSEGGIVSVNPPRSCC